MGRNASGEEEEEEEGTSSGVGQSWSTQRQLAAQKRSYVDPTGSEVNCRLERAFSDNTGTAILSLLEVRVERFCEGPTYVQAEAQAGRQLSHLGFYLNKNFRSIYGHLLQWRCQANAT